MKLSRWRLSERQTLHFIMVVCLIGVIGAFVPVVLRRHVPPLRPVRYPLVRWISPRVADTGRELRSLIVELDDPSLMSLPHPQAFSAPLWRHHLQLDPHLIQPTQSIAYLERPPPVQPPALVSAPALADALRGAAQKADAVFAEPASPPPPSAPAESAIQLDESLASARLLQQPKLPVVASETGLRPTVVRLAVASDGTVVYALLERSCGNEQADTAALSAARQLRFQWPAGAGSRDLRWGTATFLWTTKVP